MEKKIENRLKAHYKTVVLPEFVKTRKLANVNETPRIEKIVINMGLGADKDNVNSINAAMGDLAIITGQKPVATVAKKSIANFKLRENQKIGAKVTLRGNIMFEFLDKLISIALPRVRDFKGVSPKGFDGRGNYTFGITEQLVFPEIKYDKIDKIRGMDVTIVTTAKNNEDAHLVLSLLGMPFSKR